MIKNFFDMIQDFIWQGGPVLLLIFLVTFMMWALILEKIVYFRFHFPSDLNKRFQNWKIALINILG